VSEPKAEPKKEQRIILRPTR